MNCGRFDKLIDSYLDGRLFGTLLAEFHAHRLACRRCTRIVSMLQAAGDVIAQDHREPKISSDFADRVLAALPVSRKRANRSVWLVRLTAGAASLAAAAALSVAVWLPGQVSSGRTGPEPRVLSQVAVAEDSGEALPAGSVNVVHRVQETDGTLLDGKVVRDAVKHMIWWDEANRTGQ
jgi:hypothetical protein